MIGLLFALAQRSRFLPLRYFSKIYVEVVQERPCSSNPDFLLRRRRRLPRESVRGRSSDSFVFSGAYISEIIRAGIESVGKSQIESAKAIGLTRAQTYRYVIFPQALRQTLPPLAGQLVSLIKDSSLLSIISISEFTLNAREVNSNTFSTLESYIPLAIGYLVVTLPISLWTRHLETRHRYET